MAHAGTFLEFAAPLTLLFVTQAGPLLRSSVWCFVLMLHGFILGNMPAGAVFEWNLLSLYAAFFLFVGHPDGDACSTSTRLPLAIYLVVGCIVLPLVGNLVAVESLVPRRDALLRRQLGMERLALPRRELREARQVEAGRRRSSRSSSNASRRRKRRAWTHAAWRSARSTFRADASACSSRRRSADGRSRTIATSTARTSPARFSGGTSGRGISATSDLLACHPGAVRLRGRGAARDHGGVAAAARARHCTGGSSTRSGGSSPRVMRVSTSSRAARPGTTATPDRQAAGNRPWARKRSRKGA